MAVNYADAKQVPPGMWAKAGQDSRTGDWHILMAARKEDIDEGGRGHDHYWKTGGNEFHEAAIKKVRSHYC
jgi:hypothetical protein